MTTNTTNSPRFAVLYVEGQSFDAKRYDLDAVTLDDARTEAKRWLRGCQPGGTVSLLDNAIDPDLDNNMVESWVA